jgi:hypothetical protein
MTNGRSKSSRFEKSYQRALRALARMRRTGEDLTTASREERTDPRTVRKYVGTDLKRLRKDGKTLPTKSDRRRRRMVIPTPTGPVPASIHGPEPASQLGRYMSAVGTFLRTGETEDLDEFEGMSIAGHPLITDPDMLTSLADAGVLQLDSIYALPESSS